MFISPWNFCRILSPYKLSCLQCTRLPKMKVQNYFPKETCVISHYAGRLFWGSIPLGGTSCATLVPVPIWLPGILRSTLFSWLLINVLKKYYTTIYIWDDKTIVWWSNRFVGLHQESDDDKEETGEPRDGEGANGDHADHGPRLAEDDHGFRRLWWDALCWVFDEGSVMCGEEMTRRVFLYFLGSRGQVAIVWDKELALM